MMFENTLTSTCSILVKQVSDEGHNYGNYVVESEAACRFTQKTGRKVLDSAGEERVIDGILFTEVELTVDNRVAYDSYEYEVVTVNPLVDPLSDQLYGYKSYIARRRIFNEEPVTISPVTRAG